MMRVAFEDQRSANRFASEVRRLYGADRWRDLTVRPTSATVIVPEDLPNLRELATRFGGRVTADDPHVEGRISSG